MRGALLFFIVLTAALAYAWTRTAEGFADTSASASTPVTAPATLLPAQVIEAGQERYNPLTQMINLANPVVALDAATETDFNRALATTGASTTYKLPDGPPARLTAAKSCEAIKSPDCSAFSDPAFAASCGISFDQKGTDSTGKPHMGGLYTEGADKETGRPTLGSAAAGKFATTAATCRVLAEKVACDAKQDFSSPNCAQCLTTGKFTRIDPATPKLEPVLRVQGAGSLSVGGRSYTLTAQQPTTVPLTGLKEGSQLSLSLTGDAAAAYVTGFLEGQTAAGPYRIDVASLIEQDTVTGYKPRQGGVQQVAGVQCAVLRPALGKGTMTLRGSLPFTFVSTTEADAAACDNGPFLTQAASANFLQSDPCYAGSAAGGPSLACLQQKFIQVGGSTSGKGYPTTADSISPSLRGNLTEVSNYLYDMSIRASTGRNAAGQQLSVEDWNAASLFMTGQPVLSPCGSGNGTLSRDCLIYLYQNKGAGTPVGATYTVPGRAGQTYCGPEGALNPAEAEGLARGMAAGSVAGAKALYDGAYRAAMDNSAARAAREGAIKDCFGAKLAAVPMAPTTEQPKCPSWVISNGGYKEPASGNITCFSGVGLKQAQDTCCGNPQCAGFSYNTEAGSGCYKRVDKSYTYYQNPPYQGYFKPTAQ